MVWSLCRSTMGKGLSNHQLPNSLVLLPRCGVHQGMLVCGPLQATSHGWSSQDVGRVCQWVCCSLFLVTSISQCITSRPSTSTLVVSDPGFGAPIVVLNWFVGEQGSRHTSYGFVVFCSSLLPHQTGSHLCPLPLICRRLSPFHFTPNSLLFISN